MNGDNKSVLYDCKSDLQSIKNWVNKNKMDSNVKYLTSYAVIKACGTIEIVAKKILYERLSEGANIEAQAYLTRMILDSSFNPKTGKICSILDMIDSNWKKEFDNSTKGEAEKDQLNSLVNLRNDLAHGKNISVSIQTVIAYYEGSIKILDKLEKIIC